MRLSTPVGCITTNIILDYAMASGNRQNDDREKVWVTAGETAEHQNDGTGGNDSSTCIF